MRDRRDTKAGDGRQLFSRIRTPPSRATLIQADRLVAADGARVGGTEAIAMNPLAGPVEVTLLAEGAPPVATPPLPARATVPAGGRVGRGAALNIHARILFSD